jgi:Protein of unknown function (DUF3634)
MEWLNPVVVFLILAGLAWLVWRATQPPCLFVVTIRSGVPVATNGTVTPAFLLRVREVVGEYRITTGTVSGIADRGRRIRLTFSTSIPAMARQKLRNWWVESGWSAPSQASRKSCG